MPAANNFIFSQISFPYKTSQMCSVFTMFCCVLERPQPPILFAVRAFDISISEPMSAAKVHNRERQGLQSIRMHLGRAESRRFRRRIIMRSSTPSANIVFRAARGCRRTNNSRPSERIIKMERMNGKCSDGERKKKHPLACRPRRSSRNVTQPETSKNPKANAITGIASRRECSAFPFRPANHNCAARRVQTNGNN